MAWGGDSTGTGRAHAVARPSERMLELALAASAMATVDADLTTGAIVCSPRLHSIYGRVPGDPAMPATLDDLVRTVHPDDVARVREALALASRTDAPVEVECRVLRASGDHVWVHGLARRFVDPDGTEHLCGVVADVTARRRAVDERVRLEAQLRQARRMETLGALAGGIAHEFNNLLAPILGNAEVLARAFDRSDARHGLAGDIVQSALRARELVQRIVHFARIDGEESPAPVDASPPAIASSASSEGSVIRRRAPEAPASGR